MAAKLNTWKEDVNVWTELTELTEFTGRSGVSAERRHLFYPRLWRHHAHLLRPSGTI